MLHVFFIRNARLIKLWFYTMSVHHIWFNMKNKCSCIISQERILPHLSPAGLGTDAEMDGPLQPVSALPAARCTRHTSYWLFLLVLAFKWWPRINEMMIDNSWTQTCTMLIQIYFELYWIVTKPASRVWWMEEGAYALANIVVGGWWWVWVLVILI